MSTDSRHAFLTALEKRHGRAIHRFLSRRMRTGHCDVPDLVQEVFLRLLRVEDHEAIRNPQAYLYTIASHVLQQHAVKGAAASEAARFADVVRELHAADDADPELELETEQRFEALGRALEAHSPRAYATLMLHRCDGMPLHDVARRFGVSYTMAKRYLAQALSFCQRTLDETE